MADINNIRIELSNGERLDYESETSLGIKFNRIADDFIDPSKRYGEFSYTFNLPKTKNNDRVFEFPDAKGRIRVFVGKTFSCDVFNNNQQLLSGIIELVGITDDTYQCRFYSKLTQLVDELKGKKMNDMTYLPTVDWNYEVSIINHIRGTTVIPHVEFPMVYYQTPFISGGTNIPMVTKRAEINLALVYNYMNSNTGTWNKRNPRYEAAFPPAIYLKSMLDGIFADLGWTYNSSFFERADIQKIIIPFTGSGQDFTGAVEDSSPSDQLNLNKLLPKINQSEFLKTVLNVFNLYLIPDVVNKSVVIETYNTFFTDNSNPYPINVYNYEKNYLDTANLITTKDDNTNELPLGFNRIMDYGALTGANPTYIVNTSIDVRTAISKPVLTQAYGKETFNKLWNKTTGTKEIKLSLSACNYYPYTLINDRSRFNATTTALPYFTVGIPLISVQTPQSNDGKDFCEEVSQNFVEGNDPSNFDYKGGFKMLYYYGAAAYNPSIDGGLTAYNDWQWVGIATGGTVTVPTFARVPVCIASPFVLLTKEQFDSLKSNIPLSSLEYTDERGAEVHSVLLTYYSAGTDDDTHDPTTFSLTFGENSVYDNIYSVFHKKKYDDLENSYVLSGTMRMNENDWREMQINRTLLFDGELYKLVSIKGYDPILRTAQIEMIKKS